LKKQNQLEQSKTEKLKATLKAKLTAKTEKKDKRTETDKRVILVTRTFENSRNMK
jgi:hypothetical protein